MATIPRRADMRIRGTRPTSAGSRTAGGASPPTATTAGYRGSAMWPGITTGHDARCSCTWADREGQYQVKFRDALCVTHPRTAVAW